MTTEKIRARLDACGIPCGAELPEKLKIYMDLLAEWNAVMDLTAVTDEDETLDKHFVDSLSVVPTDLLSGGKTLIDVGTGAGFPGMVLALACPDMEVTLLDAQQKRLTFLQAVCDRLKVQNVRIVHARAEDGARMPELREHYDYAVARAVAPLNVLCEYLLPYVRVGGKVICWKGPALDGEAEQGAKAAGILGGSMEDVILCPIPGRDWDHRLQVMGKIAPTPKKYPRKAGTPKTSPLG